MNIDGTLNVYHVFRSMLLAVIKFNELNRLNISSVVCPGMGTGIGGLSEYKAAKQMAFAYSQVTERDIVKSASLRLKENRELELLR